VDDVQSITRANIDALLEFLPIFETEGFEFGTWVSMHRDGRTSSYFNVAPEASQFMRALYENGWVVAFDWPAWQDEAARLVSSREAIRDADLKDLRKLLTIHARKERFCEGHMAAMHRSAHLTAVLRRLQDLRERIEE